MLTVIPTASNSSSKPNSPIPKLPTGSSFTVTTGLRLGFLDGGTVGEIVGAIVIGLKVGSPGLTGGGVGNGVGDGVGMGVGNLGDKIIEK